VRGPKSNPAVESGLVDIIARGEADGEVRLSAADSEASGGNFVPSDVFVSNLYTLGYWDHNILWFRGRRSLLLDSHVLG
jgi:hypothetical protein